MEDMRKTFRELGWYVMTGLLGFMIQGLIIYPIVFGKLDSITQKKLYNVESITFTVNV